MKTAKYTQKPNAYLFPILTALLMLWGPRLGAQTPNDPLYPQQTYLDVINIQDLWNLTTGNPNVKIAIIATGGVYTDHEDLSSRTTSKAFRIGADKRPLGTLGAGIVGAATNNGKGIAGIDWDADLLSYDVGRTFEDENNLVTFYGLDQSVVDDDINAAVSAGADILFTPFKMVPSGYIPEIR